MGGWMYTLIGGWVGGWDVPEGGAGSHDDVVVELCEGSGRAGALGDFVHLEEGGWEGRMGGLDSIDEHPACAGNVFSFGSHCGEVGGWVGGRRRRRRR